MTAHPDSSVSPGYVWPGAVTRTLRYGLAWPSASTTMTATKAAVSGTPVPFLGASAACDTTGLTVPMFGQVTDTVTPRVGYGTDNPPAQADWPVPAGFQAAERTTVYGVPSMTRGAPADWSGRGWGLVTMAAFAICSGPASVRENSSRTMSISREARFAAAIRARLFTLADWACSTTPRTAEATMARMTTATMTSTRLIPLSRSCGARTARGRPQAAPGGGVRCCSMVKGLFVR